jgi:hypothetical protein
MPHSGYSTSYNKAVAALQTAEDPAALAARCGAVNSAVGYDLPYFGSPCTVTLPECNFAPPALSLGEKILILHYLSSKDPFEESPPQATFQSLPGGMFYFPTFRKRGPDRVLSDYGENLSQLLEAAEAAGWPAGSIGDVSVNIPALPLIDVTVAAYAGDEEFPAEVNFLFRKDITSFLPLEDIAVLGGIVATKLTILKNAL